MIKVDDKGDSNMAAKGGQEENTDPVLGRLTVLENLVNQILRSSEENNRALRGYNGNTGLVSKVDTAITAVNEMQASYNAMQADVTGLKNQHTSCPIQDVTALIYGDRKDVDKPGLIEDLRAIRGMRKFVNGAVAAVITATIINLIINLVM